MVRQDLEFIRNKDGYRMDDIRYKWANGLNYSLDVSPTIELPQLKYKDYKLGERQFRVSTGRLTQQ
jgi:hypothetical protein